MTIPSAERLPPSTPRAKLKALALAFAALTLGLLIMIAALDTYLAIQDSRRIKQNTEIQTFIKAQAIRNGNLSELIRSCTTPEGPCYKRSGQRTQTAVVDISRVSVYAAACADQPATQTTEQIQRCVMLKLATDQPPPQERRQ